MKKFFILICTGILACSLLTGCGQTSGKGQSSPFDGKDLTDVVLDIYDKAADFELGLMDPVLVETDMIPYYIGAEDTTGIKEVAASEPLMNVVPYSLCLIRLEDGADVEAIRKNIFEQANASKWICVSADKVTVNNAGNVILLLMASSENTDKVYKAFEQLAGDAIGEPLVRNGVE